MRCGGRAVLAAAAYRGPYRHMKSDYQKLLPEISAEVASKIVFDDLAQMLTVDIPRRLGTAGAVALRHVPANETFSSLSSPDIVLPYSHPFVQRLLKAEHPIVWAGMDSQGDAELSAFVEAHHIALSIPLRRGTMLLGAYNLGPKLSGEPYDENDCHFLDMLAWPIAASLENAHLYEELRVHRDHLAELVDKHTTQIRSEQQKLATILANVGDAILIIDTDGLIEYVNNMWVRQSGFSPQAVLGTDVRRFYDRPFSETMIETFRETMHRQEGWRGEAAHRRKDKESFPVELAVAPLRVGRDAVTHFVISQRDMSAHKELDRFKTDFISDVSHELRAPISNFKLYLDLVAEGSPDKRAHYIATLKSEAVRLERLVSDLANLLKLEQGVIPMEIAPLDLTELAGGVAAAYDEMASEQVVTITVVGAPDVPMVRADRYRIEQALTNLVVNAITYTDAGGAITIEVGAARRENGLCAFVAVRDTGIGIDPREQAKIFNRFYRAASARKTGAPGTGLGLAIVKQIMVMHGGDVAVQSQPGVGSTFTLWLPIAGEAAEDSAGE